MIRFTLLLLARSMRWVPPALLLLTWIGLVLADGGPPLPNLVATAPALAICATWTTISIGGIDDDAHRDLLASALGSHAALHRRRAVASAALGALVATAVASILAAAAAQPGHTRSWVLAAGVMLGFGAVATGVAIGSWLHPPVLRNRGLSVLLATGAIVAILAAPPVTHALRQFERGRIGSVAVGLAIASVLAVSATNGAAALAARRA